MNRKDFELIARVLKTTKPVGPDNARLYSGGWYRTVHALADGMAGADGCSGFDRARFLLLCGVPLVVTP